MQYFHINRTNCNGAYFNLLFAHFIVSSKCGNIKKYDKDDSTADLIQIEISAI